MVAYPAGDVLRRGVDIQHFVDVLVVEGAFDNPFDVGEVGYHAVLVECLCLAEDGDDPVVPVQGFALAFVTEVEIMCRRDGQRFLNVVHRNFVCLISCN